MKRKSFYVVIMCIVLGLAFVAEGDCADKTPYKVGAVLSITGPASFLGEPERRTLELIKEKVNAQGGINGHPLDLIIYDNATEATKHVMALKRLIEQDQVCAIIGPSTSGNTLAGIPIIEKAGVPNVSLAASVKVVEPVKKWVFKTPKTDALNIRKLLGHAKKMGYKKVAIIHSDSGYGKSGEEQFVKIAPAMGFEVVGAESFSDKDSDMTAQLTRLKAKGAEAIVGYSASPAGSIIVKNMKQLGMTAQLYHSTGWASQKYVDLAGEAANGVMVSSGRFLVMDQIPYWSTYKPVLEVYKTEFESKYKLSVNEFGGHAWDAMMLVLMALEKVGDDKAKIRDSIENTKNFLGINGYFSFSPEDHNGLDSSSFVMIRVENMKFKLAE